MLFKAIKAIAIVIKSVKRLQIPVHYGARVHYLSGGYLAAVSFSISG